MGWSANFSVKHMMIAKVHGGFEKMSGKLTLDREDLAKSQVEATIDAASINTRESKYQNRSLGVLQF